MDPKEYSAIELVAPAAVLAGRFHPALQRVVHALDARDKVRGAFLGVGGFSCWGAGSVGVSPLSLVIET